MSRKQWGLAAGRMAGGGEKTIEGQHHVNLGEEDMQTQKKPKAAERRVSQLSIEEKESEGPKFDQSVWVGWDEMEGDKDASGDISLDVGILYGRPPRFRTNHRGGDVIMKTSDIPVFASGFGMNIGPSISGHCQWQFEVIHRDGNMYIGLILAERLADELDRRWDTKCFFDHAFFWSSPSGLLMNGPHVIKTLPTDKVPFSRFNMGDVVTVDLKLDDRELGAVVMRVTSEGSTFPGENKCVFKVAKEFEMMLKDLEALPDLYLDGKILRPQGFNKKENTFWLQLEGKLQEGSLVLFQLTGQVTFKLNDAYAGVIRGVPSDVVPAVCLTNKGDKVRLKGFWSARDQKIIDEVRKNLENLYDAMNQVELMNFVATSQRGLTDWTILKALRRMRYDVDETCEFLLSQCENLCQHRKMIDHDLRVEEMKANALTSFQDHVDDSREFKMGSSKYSANPPSIHEMLRRR